MTDTILDIDNLVVTVGKTKNPNGPRIIDGVSIKVAKGETLCVVGESGSGKSVTSLTTMGLLPKNALHAVGGSVKLVGEELLTASDRRLRELRATRMAMIFQEPMTALNPMHTIGHQVAEPLLRHTGCSAAEAKRQAIALLDRVGLPDPARRYDAYPHQFSGGQRQRITIAMALACKPDVLIADEPTTALDVTIQRQILDLIADLVAEQGMAMILISHDLGVIAENVQRMIVMYGGTVVENGTTDAVFSRMGHPYTQGLFQARPRLGARKGTRLATIAGTVPELADLPAGCAFADRCNLVIDACRTALPPVAEIGAGHAVRCIRTDVALTRDPVGVIA